MGRSPWILILATLGAGCGANTSDAFLGTWKMSQVHCNTNHKTLPARLTYTITYNADSTFTSTLTGANCPFVNFTGVYDRSGLSVSQTNKTIDCGTGCVINVINLSCTGQADLDVDADRFQISAPDGTHLDQAAHSAQTFCSTAPLVGMNEDQLFQRQ